MRTERDQLITPPVFDQACREVATALESFRVDFKDLPVIIVAAWYDGLCGIPECVDSLNDWLHDSAILTEKQVAAIREILKCLPV
jgi:hypothetical protein